MISLFHKNYIFLTMAFAKQMKSIKYNVKKKVEISKAFI